MATITDHFPSKKTNRRNVKSEKVTPKSEIKGELSKGKNVTMQCCDMKFLIKLVSVDRAYFNIISY